MVDKRDGLLEFCGALTTGKIVPGRPPLPGQCTDIDLFSLELQPKKLASGFPHM